MITHGPTYLDLIERGAVVNAARPAIVFGDRTMTFAEVNSLANKFANALRALGVVPGSRVALLINNGLFSVPVDFACVKTGINRVPLNARLSQVEHVRMLQEVDAKLLIYGGDLRDRAAELQAALPGLRCYGLGTELSERGDLLAISETMSDDRPVYRAEQEDLVLTLFTSGTTGVLKAARYTQRSYAALCRNILLNLFPVAPSDVMLHCGSLIHASGTFVLPFWLRGGLSVVLPHFAPKEYLAAIGLHRPTAINLVPTMLQMLLEEPEIDRSDVSSLQRIIYGASPMPRDVINRAIARFGRDKFWQYYGQTEAPLCLAVLTPEDHLGESLGACGRPALDVELRLVDESGACVGPGEPGEILVRGPSVVAGYFNAPELTAETFDAEGWVHTRDVGVLDDRGLLHLRDRTSDMIISGGYNVYPREVEDALMSHPAVLEAAVIGAPHDKWVEQVIAFIRLRDGHSASEAELIAHAASRIASYKKPHQIRFIEVMPKTVIGKLDRKKLRLILQDSVVIQI